MGLLDCLRATTELGKWTSVKDSSKEQLLASLESTSSNLTARQPPSAVKPEVYVCSYKAVLCCVYTHSTLTHSTHSHTRCTHTLHSHTHTALTALTHTAFTHTALTHTHTALTHTHTHTHTHTALTHSTHTHTHTHTCTHSSHKHTALTHHTHSLFAAFSPSGSLWTSTALLLFYELL